jgi:hypothetical protein
MSETLADCPRTKEGWIPIAYFREAFFTEDEEDFLVWLKGVSYGRDVMLSSIASWTRDEEDGPAKFVGEWLYVGDSPDMEVVAFQPVPQPGDLAEMEALTRKVPRIDPAPAGAPHEGLVHLMEVA